jgi:hypothetical protein
MTEGEILGSLEKRVENFLDDQPAWATEAVI